MKPIKWLYVVPKALVYTHFTIFPRNLTIGHLEFFFGSHENKIIYSNEQCKAAR